MPDGQFKYLLNYKDHGVKKLTTIQLVSNQAISIAFLSILQANNGGEFAGHAHNHVGKRMVLEDELIDLIIKELKNLLLKCQMVRGSPRHSKSNGGIERVNQTVQKKLGAWMKDNASTHWAI